MAAARGFTLIEVIVAMLIVSVVALGLAQTLIVAHDGRKLGAAWMRATQLAVEQLERVRAGGAIATAEVVEGFTRTWRSDAVAAYPHLRRVEVSVMWTDSEPREYRLMALFPAIP